MKLKFILFVQFYFITFSFSEDFILQNFKISLAETCNLQSFNDDSHIYLIRCGHLTWQGEWSDKNYTYSLIPSVLDYMNSVATNYIALLEIREKLKVKHPSELKINFKVDTSANKFQANYSYKNNSILKQFNFDKNSLKYAIQIDTVKGYFRKTVIPKNDSGEIGVYYKSLSNNNSFSIYTNISNSNQKRECERAIQEIHIID